MEFKEIKHVDVWSAAKVFATMNLVIAIVVGIILTVAVIAGSPVLFSGMLPLQGLVGGIGGAVTVMIMSVVFGAVFGYIFGAVFAIVYNLAAGLFGGLKIELK